MTLEQRQEIFANEWLMRESILFLAGYRGEILDEHRKEILHRYQLTEEEGNEAISKLRRSIERD